MPDAALPEGVSGWCAGRFAGVAGVLAEQLAAGVHDGAAVAVRHRGAPVVDIWGGTFSEDTLAVSFSTTKGPVALAVHMALERAGVSYDTPVAEVWPEFSQAGKAAVTIRQALCHEAGIPQVRDQVDDVWAMTDWDAMVAMAERLAPLWPPGTANGYHAMNWGWLAGELVGRVDGRPVGRFLAEEVGGPLGLDGLFLPAPAEERHRLVPVALDPAHRSLPPLDDLLPAGSIPLLAISPKGDMVEFLNSEAGRSACVPAVGGAFTARSLATVYAAMERGGRLGGARLVSEGTVAAATAVQNTRPDLVLFLPVRWRLGFMSFDEGDAYGHAGFGGSLALADPGAELAVAVTVTRLQLDLVGDARARALVRAARAAVDALG